MRIVLAGLLSLLTIPALAQSLTVPPEPIIHGALNTYLRPGFQAFATATQTFKSSAMTLCDTPSAASLTTAQAQFKSTALAYAHVEFARFGPLDVADRADRILFWPDPKGIALHQVQGALAGKDATVLAPQTLAPKSVAMQGLVAAEYLLFGTGADGLASPSADATFRCGYIRSITTLIDGLASTIEAGWRDDSATGAAAQMLDPKPQGQEYRSATEVVQKLVQALSVGTDTIRDQRVSPILGAAEGVPKPRSALFWRSGLTAPFLAADFAGLRDLFEGSALADALAQAGSASTSNSIRFEFDTAAKAASLIASPIEIAVADPAQFAQLKELVFVTRSLGTLLSQNLTDALGLTNGFSLLDGD
jgi:uncharacterized protein